MRRPRHRTGAGRVLAVALLCAPFGAAGVFHVRTRTRVVAAGYDLARLQGEHDGLSDDRARLVMEVATLRAPGRLERRARERLGMAPPAPGAVVASVSGGKVENPLGPDSGTVRAMRGGAWYNTDVWTTCSVEVPGPPLGSVR